MAMGRRAALSGGAFLRRDSRGDRLLQTRLSSFVSRGGFGHGGKDDPVESADDFERRLFGDKNVGVDSKSDDFERRLFGDKDREVDSKKDSFFKQLDWTKRANERSNFGPRTGRSGGSSQFMEGFRESFNPLDDGMDEKLDDASRTFVYGDDVEDEDYSYRPDVTFLPGNTYTLQDLDLTKPAAQRTNPRPEFETTTKEVLKKADFRNVRFLSNFLTEAGIIIKRSQTRISAKAQRKIAREIKTARAFGLLPFTTMGTMPFSFGRSMEDTGNDYDHGAYRSRGNPFNMVAEAPGAAGNRLNFIAEAPGAAGNRLNFVTGAAEPDGDNK